MALASEFLKHFPSTNEAWSDIQAALTKEAMAVLKAQKYGNSFKASGGENSKTMTRGVKTATEVKEIALDKDILVIEVTGNNRKEPQLLMYRSLSNGYASTDWTVYEYDRRSDTFYRISDRVKDPYKNITAAIKAIKALDTAPEIAVIYKDKMRDVKRVNRYYARDGKIPLPKDADYIKFNSAAKRDLQVRLAKYKTSKSPTIKDLRDLKGLLLKVQVGKDNVAYVMGSSSTAALQDLVGGEPVVIDYRPESFGSPRAVLKARAQERGIDLKDTEEMDALYAEIQAEYPEIFKVVVKLENGSLIVKEVLAGWQDEYALKKKHKKQ